MTAFKAGDHVLISCVSACGKCEYCRKQMYSHCTTGGWILGNTIDGTQAEFVRIPYADTSLYPIPDGADEEALVMLSDILPTGFECGVLNGKVAPGSTVAIVGAGPIGLAALLTAQFYSPAEIIMIDLDDNRLEVAKRFGATATINSTDGKALETVMKMTGKRGVDTAIEAVGIPVTFELCQKLVAPGGTIANIGVHGKKVDLHLEELWDRNISITTRLVDTATIPMLFKTVGVAKDRPQAASSRIASSSIKSSMPTRPSATPPRPRRSRSSSRPKRGGDDPAPTAASRFADGRNGFARHVSGKTCKHSPGAILEKFNALVTQPAHHISCTVCTKNVIRS